MTSLDIYKTAIDENQNNIFDIITKAFYDESLGKDGFDEILQYAKQREV